MLSKIIQRSHTILHTLLVAACVGALLSGCRGGGTPVPSIPGVSPTAPVQTETVPPTLEPTLTATTVPLALRVNGQGVSAAAFDADLLQLQQAQQQLAKTATPEEQRQQITDYWIDTLLLQAAAIEGGFTVDDAALQSEVERIAAQRAGGAALSDWYAANGYTEETFREVLRAQMAAAWQRDQLAAQVSTAAEQVHARQILTLDEETANLALSQVRTPGVNFAAQAYRYDPATGGDLGWFPRGYLTQPEVEEAAFALQPGEVSDVIQSAIGYHIVQVISREPSKALSPDALRVLREQAVVDWLFQQREAAQIELIGAAE